MTKQKTNIRAHAHCTLHSINETLNKITIDMKIYRTLHMKYRTHFKIYFSRIKINRLIDCIFIGLNSVVLFVYRCD